ncbi:hypothetical protein SCLCIDRAFT_33181 [Scleroderma citrinum Foug A]|uniref:Uncharacterized protein n=1 Tax=Scleroderma citrinum Foug A TaxID=1036808 RepID=A0A0C2YPY5_9AGAM|nr:hypothetical protein SCLCIDRAFT_33181 [Scleroderma citrinum Foug A]
MDDFINCEDGEEAGGMNEQGHEERRHEKGKKERQCRRVMGNCPELSGMDDKSGMPIQQYLSSPFQLSAWEEVHEVLGDGHKYHWALVGDDEMEPYEDIQKPEMKETQPLPNPLNPSNEYAALGPDITVISFEDEDQHLIPKEKLLVTL